MSSSRTAVPLAQAAHSGEKVCPDSTPKIVRANLARVSERHGARGDRGPPVDRGNRDSRIVDDAVRDHLRHVRLDAGGISGNFGDFPGELFFPREIFRRGVHLHVVPLHRCP